MTMGKKNGTLKIVGIVITLSVIGATIVASYTLLGAKADANAEDVRELEDEQFLQWIDIDGNSDRAIRIEFQMTNIEKKLDTILEKVERLHE